MQAAKKSAKSGQKKNVKAEKPAFRVVDRNDPMEMAFGLHNFESIRIAVEISNVTTKTKVAKTPAPEITEFADQGMVLELARRSGAKGHLLLLKFIVTNPRDSKEFEFEGTGNITEIENLEETDRITVKFVQFEQEEWVRFQELFSERQEEISEFLMSARGY